jgi:HlyD family secretion protein
VTGKLKLVLASAAAVAVLGLAGIQVPQRFSGTSHSLIYETAEIDYGQIRRFVSTSGPVRARVTVSVGSQLSGQIRELKADYNTEVQAGDELAIIDDKSFVARVAQARSDLAAARAMLANQEAALIKAEAVERNAGRLMGRQRTLADKGISATTTLDNATRDAEVAKAEVEVAKAQVQNAKATIAQREAQLAQSEIDLERTRIRSPIDGTVIVRAVDVGQTVAASLQAPELFKIAQDLRRIRIEAQVSEADVGAVAAGNSVEFSVDAYPERRFEGRVVQVRLGANEINNVVTYTVIIEAANDDRKLLPGMTADARIESARIDKALRIPSDALRFKPRGKAAPAAVRTSAAQRLDRELARVSREVALTPEQTVQVSRIMKDASAELGINAGGGAAIASGGARAVLEGEPEGRVLQRLAQAVASVITEAQRPAFVAWKAEREAAAGRSSRRDVTVWVLDGAGKPESRQIDLGLVDDHFAEVLGDTLRAGDKVVLRSREAGKK